MKWLLPLLLAACAAPEVGGIGEVPVRAVYASPYCGATGLAEDVTRIGDARALDAQWRRHTASEVPPPLPPVVDFTKRHLVLLTLGQQPTAGHSLELASATGELRGRTLSVAIRRQRPAADAFAAQVITSPCLLIEIDTAADRLDAVVVREPS